MITEIIEREGRTFSNRSADKGGPTKFGVTQATLARWRGSPVTVEDVRALTEPEARRIYAAEYLRPWAWLPDERLRVLLVDWTVTSGLDDPTRGLQVAVHATLDGVLGAQTKRLAMAALEHDTGEVYRTVLIQRAELYMRIALDEPRLRVLMNAAQPLQVTFLRGWIRRVLAFI